MPRRRAGVAADEPPPAVSCKSWAIADGHDGRIVWAMKQFQTLQPASLAKICNCLVVLLLCEEHPHLLRESVTVSPYAASINGTSAELKAYDRLTVRDLLYGIMVPSGNDAATAIAEHFGHWFDADTDSNRIALLNDNADPALPRFVAEMNRTAARVGCVDTHFVNPHGMGHPGNRTCAADILKIVYRAIRFRVFRHIVAAKCYCCQALSHNDTYRGLCWNNTNILLFDGHGYDGIKTGWIPNAHGQKIHGCLTTSVRWDGYQLLVCVLGSKTQRQRFSDTQKLVAWAFNTKLQVTPRFPPCLSENKLPRLMSKEKCV